MISRMSDRRPIKILKVHYQDEADLKRRIWHTKMNGRVDYTKCQVSKIEDLLQLPSWRNWVFPLSEAFSLQKCKTFNEGFTIHNISARNFIGTFTWLILIFLGRKFWPFPVQKSYNLCGSLSLPIHGCARVLQTIQTDQQKKSKESAFKVCKLFNFFNLFMCNFVHFSL